MSSYLSCCPKDAILRGLVLGKCYVICRLLYTACYVPEAPRIFRSIVCFCLEINFFKVVLIHLKSTNTRKNLFVINTNAQIVPVTQTIVVQISHAQSNFSDHMANVQPVEFFAICPIEFCHTTN